MTDAHTLCIKCRSTFTDEQIRGHSGCPTCGDKGVPADTRKKATLTLTHHEWRILFMWAHDWASQCDRQDENCTAYAAISAVAREATRQAPDLPSLSLRAELKEVASEFGAVTLHQDGETAVIEPEKKH